MKLQNKIALVTGAGRGIGRGVALTLAREGADVAVNYWTPPEREHGRDNRQDAEEVVAEIRKLGRRAVAVEGNVADGASVQQMVKAATEQLGSIDILVNNAGVESIVPLLDITEQEFDRVVGINLKGSWLCAQAVAREMVNSGRGGAIVNTGSIQCGLVLPGRTHYAPSKRGVEALTRNLAVELAPNKIRVNCINPGVIATDMTRWILDNPEILSKILDTIPAHRPGSPEEIGTVAAFLASDEASYLTGQCIYVDGGMILT